MFALPLLTSFLLQFIHRASGERVYELIVRLLGVIICKG